MSKVGQFGRKITILTDKSRSDCSTWATQVVDKKKTNLMNNTLKQTQIVHDAGGSTVWILYARPFCALSVGVLQSHCDSDVNKTTRFKTKAKTKTEGHKTKTKTIGPITTYSLQTVNEIIFYSTVFYNLCTLSTS